MLELGVCRPEDIFKCNCPGLLYFLLETWSLRGWPTCLMVLPTPGSTNMYHHGLLVFTWVLRSLKFWWVYFVPHHTHDCYGFLNTCSVGWDLHYDLSWKAFNEYYGFSFHYYFAHSVLRGQVLFFLLRRCLLVCFGSAGNHFSYEACLCREPYMFKHNHYLWLVLL